MIEVEGYKAFHGTMRIMPKNTEIFPYEMTGDWLYKPEYKCWYGGGHSYPEEACEVIRDDTIPFEVAKNDPLTTEELRQMDGQPVFIEHDILPKFSHVWVIWNNHVSDNIHDGLDGYGNFWRAYRRPPEVTL